MFDVTLIDKNTVTLWCRLVFTMVLSYVVTFGFVCGTVTLKSNSFVTGFASGLIAASLVLVFLFRSSPLTKGLTIALPSEIIKGTDSQNIVEVKR